MKNLFICLLTILMFSCNTKVQKSIDNTEAVVDTVYIEVPMLNEERVKELEADVAYWKSVVDSLDSTIPYDDYMNARRMEKIKYYITITERNSNNKQFFFGWIKRTMSEK